MSTTEQEAPVSVGGGVGGYPPVVVLPDPDAYTSVVNPSPAHRRAASRAAAALAAAAVAAFDGPTTRGDALSAARRETHALYLLGAKFDPPVDGNGIAPLSPIQAHFRLRGAPLSGAQAATHASAVLAAALADVADAPLAGSDLERMLAAMRLCLCDLYGVPQPPATPGDGQSSHAEVPAPVDGDCEARWQTRWLVGHHMHALFNVLSAVALREAREALDEGAPAAAVPALRRATIYVEAFPAARALALALPASFYNTTLRPSMQPPLAPTPLSGAMHVEYRRYQAGIEALLQAVPEPIAQLAASQLLLALAREELLEADLVDAQRHACLVEPLVGAAKSLAQHARTKDNAVSVLRRIQAHRSTRYAPFMRFSAESASATP